jgi:hypothetical protein
MNGIRNTAAAAAAAILLAACSSGPHGPATAASGTAGSSGPPGQAGTQSPAATSSAVAGTASTAPAAATADSPTSAGRLTMRQAETAYVRIVQPGTALADKLAGAASGTGPFSQFRTDALAYVGELRKEIGKFQAVRWPAHVAPRINAMVRTEFPADIKCLQAMAGAGSMAASQAVAGSNHDCMVADNSTIPGTLQSMLSQ